MAKRRFRFTQVARTHPETGRTTLYVQQGFVRKFADEHNIPEDEQRAILLEMKLQEGRPEYTCRVKWEPGTLAMWGQPQCASFGQRGFLAVSTLHGTSDHSR